MTESSEIQSNEDLLKLANPFAQLMNHMQLSDGHHIYDVVSAALYAVGCALAQIGSHIDVKAPINEVLPPLSSGYNESMERIKKTMI